MLSQNSDSSLSQSRDLLMFPGSAWSISSHFSGHAFPVFGSVPDHRTRYITPFHLNLLFLLRYTLRATRESIPRC